MGIFAPVYPAAIYSPCVAISSGSLVTWPDCLPLWHFNLKRQPVAELAFIPDMSWKSFFICLLFAQLPCQNGTVHKNTQTERMCTKAATKLPSFWAHCATGILFLHVCKSHFMLKDIKLCENIIMTTCQHAEVGELMLPLVNMWVYFYFFSHFHKFPEGN